MTLKKMLFLAAILAAMALYITKVELAKDELKHSAEQPLEKLVPQSVSEISIAGEKGSYRLVNTAPKANATPAPDSSVTEEEAAQWKVDGINDSGLERGVLNTLLSSLRTLKLENGLTAEETDKDLGIYGLSTPALTVGVKGEGVDRTYQVGKLNEYVNKRYVKDAASSTVFLATNELFLAASKPSADYRDHSPANIASESITKLSVLSPSSTLILEQMGGNWKFVSPGAYTANNYVTNNFIRELANTKAVNFVDDAAGKEGEYGLTQPLLTIDIQQSGDAKKPMTVKFGSVATEKEGKKSSKFYMQVVGKAPIFEIGGDPRSRFLKTADELREKQLFRFATDRIKEVRIEVPGRAEVVLTKPDMAWKVDGKDTDAPFVSEFFNSLTELSAVDFPEQGANLGFDAPNAKITCTLIPETEKGSEERKVLVIGKPVAKPPGTYAAMVEGSNEPFIISGESLHKITPRSEALLKSEAAPQETPPAEPAAPAANPK